MSPRPTNPGKVLQRRRAATLLQGETRRRAGVDRVDCDLARSGMTPCVRRDGALCCDDDGLCVGCGHDPRGLLVELRDT